VAIKGVIFDVGGVLAADVWEHLFLGEDGIAARYHLDKGRIRKIGEGLWEQFTHRPATDRDNWESLEKEYWAAFIERSGLQVWADDLIQLTDAFIRPVPGMRELLERLRSAGIGLAICSNNTEFWFRRQVDKLGLERFFSPERIVLSCHLGVSKSSPHHEMFQAAVDALRIGKEACLFVDDREENIRRAVEFGLTGILFPSHSDVGSRYLEAVLGKISVFA
jgi:HAD superfamily hydrolase (TIGR01509 family)